MNSGQACRSCRGSCTGRSCFGGLPGDEIVVSPPSPIVEPLSGYLVRGKLNPESLQDILDEADWELFGHDVGVICGLTQGLQRATVTRGLPARPDRLKGRSIFNSFSPSMRPSVWLAAEEGPTTTIVKGPDQFQEKFPLRTLLSAPLRSPCRMVAAVLYTYTQPPAAYLRRLKSALEKVVLRPFIRATVRADCLRASS